ncbi:MAG: peptide chain release factor 2, partial [Lachnospiraceae bacterium]|nr:peptide chain release factor 2 [Lachnospiraceae bacterium]
MVELDNLKLEIKEYEAPLAELKSSLDLESKANRIAELSRLMEEPGFWDDPEKSQKDSQLLGDLRNDVNGYNDLEAKYNDMLELIDMAN